MAKHIGAGKQVMQFWSLYYERRGRCSLVTTLYKMWTYWMERDLPESLHFPSGWKTKCNEYYQEASELLISSKKSWTLSRPSVERETTRKWRKVSRSSCKFVLNFISFEGSVNVEKETWRWSFHGWAARASAWDSPFIYKCHSKGGYVDSYK